MVSDLAKYEQDFARKALSEPQVKYFFRSWRKRAAWRRQAWSEIREDSVVGSKKICKGKAIIDSLRKHLVELQRGRCCYCRRVLDGIAYARQIDHVLPKNVYPQYAFVYRNLAVACFNCNHLKGVVNWSMWPLGRKKYIGKKDCVEFFHPRFHDYDSHVRYLHLETNGASICVYAGITPQGMALCANLLNKSAKRVLSVSANSRFSDAINKLRAQVGWMVSNSEDSHLMDFIESLELAAAPV